MSKQSTMYDSRVDHHKRNLPTIKRHIWLLWKLTKHTTIIKIFEFGWETVQRAACSSKFICPIGYYKSNRIKLITLTKSLVYITWSHWAKKKGGQKLGGKLEIEAKMMQISIVVKKKFDSLFLCPILLWRQIYAVFDNLKTLSWFGINLFIFVHLHFWKL